MNPKALTAQDAVNIGSNVSISVNITGAIKTLTMQSLNLEEANRSNETINIDPQTSPNAGKVVAIGSPSSRIRVNYLKNRNLKQKNGSSSLEFTYKVAANKQNDQSSAELLLNDNKQYRFNDNGRFYFWVGGSVNIATAIPGNYVGEFSLDIEYY